MLVKEHCIRLLVGRTASSFKGIQYPFRTQTRNATNTKRPVRPSPLQSVTYGSKDAPVLQPTGRFNTSTPSTQSDSPEAARQREIAQENAEKGVNFNAPDPSKKSSSKKKKKFTLPQTNNQITHPVITFIDSTGQSHPQTPLFQALSSFSRQTHTLVLVDPSNATCRLFTNKEYNAHLDTLRQRFKQEHIPAKELQITWNVGDNDLMYRLNRAIKHLSRGGRMNIIMGARKVKLVRTRQQREELLGKIREVLKPYAVEWREMTGGFPNAELWFQGIASKDAPPESGLDDEDVEDEMEEEEEDDKETDTTGNGSDDQSMSWEEFQTQRAKFKGKANRRAQRAEADKAFEKTTGSSTEAISKAFWQELATPTTKAPKTTSGSKKTSNIPDLTTTTKADEDAVKTAERARLAELSGKVVPEKQEEAIEAQNKLQSVAAQFSKLGGTKSLFGSKIGKK